MSNTPTIRRWVYDPQAPRPVWVIRKFHDIGFECADVALVSGNFGEAHPGDTICMDVVSGRYWVEKKEAAK